MQSAYEFPDGFESDERFCAESLSVQTKQGLIVPAVWGEGQRRFFAACKKQEDAGKPIRIIGLKPRQVWWSTAVAMKAFKKIVFTPGQSGLVVAHDDASARKIFEYYKRFQQYYRPFRGSLDVPRLVAPRNLDSPNVEIMKWANRSFVEIETANNVTGGRSFTARVVHLSEMAFYARPAELMTGLMQSIPDDPQTMVVIESTANGMGGAFYDEWNRAVDGKSDFLPIFFAWWEHEEYRRAIDTSPDIFQRSLSKVEIEMAQAFKLSPEQLNWRRWTIANKCQGDEDRFRQEYPATAEEAFIASGRPRFRPIYIRRHQAVEPDRGELRVEEVSRRSELRFYLNEHGALSVWERPDPHQQYVIGADTAEGIDSSEGTGTPDPDYSVADVFRANMRIQVAQLRERLTPPEFARYLYDLGKWYNWAFIVPEVDGIGQSTVDGLAMLGYPTDRIYHRVIYDEAGRPRSKKIGYKTTTITREQLLAAYEGGLGGHLDGGIVLRSAISIREAYSFKIKPNGRAEAEKGAHDDTVFSGGLATIGLQEMPRSDTSVLKNGRPAVSHWGKGYDAKEADIRSKLARM